jgi:hypothetical protein
MSLSELKTQVSGLSLDERRQLTAYLVGLRHKELLEYRESLTARIDDTTPANWVSFEEFDKRVSA